MHRTKRILNLLTLLCAFLLFSCKTVDENKKDSASVKVVDVSKYKSLAESLTKECPVMLDEFTRRDLVVFSEKENAMYYYYTVVVMQKEDFTEGEIIEAEKMMKKMFPMHLKMNPNVQQFKNDNITVVNVVKDKNGVQVLKIVTTSNEY